MSPTEAHLVEAIAVTQWKMGRMEALISSSNMQSAFMHLAFKNPEKYRTKKGTISFPDLTHNEHEQKIQNLLNGIQRHQGALERSYYRALDTLERIQEMRRRRTPEKPAEQPEQPVQPEEPKLKVMTAGAGGGGWGIEIQQEGKPATRRRFGNAWLHKSGLPEDVEL